MLTSAYITKVMHLSDLLQSVSFMYAPLEQYVFCKFHKMQCGWFTKGK